MSVATAANIFFNDQPIVTFSVIIPELEASVG